MKPILNLFFLLVSSNLFSQDYIAEWTSSGHPLYEVQQSVDNIDWEFIGTVVGSDTELTYQYPVSQAGYFYRVKAGNVKSASVFVEPVILPVRLISESVKNNILEWTVGEEQNIDYYLIESSTDGVHFSEIRRVAATGSVTYKISLK